MSVSLMSVWGERGGDKHTQYLLKTVFNFRWWVQGTLLFLKRELQTPGPVTNRNCSRARHNFRTRFTNW